MSRLFLQEIDFFTYPDKDDVISQSKASGRSGSPDFIGATRLMDLLGSLNDFGRGDPTGRPYTPLQANLFHFYCRFEYMDYFA